MSAANAEAEMEARIARLESDVAHIRTDVAEVKTDIRRLDAKIDAVKDAAYPSAGGVFHDGAVAVSGMRKFL